MRHHHPRKTLGYNLAVLLAYVTVYLATGLWGPVDTGCPHPTPNNTKHVIACIDLHDEYLSQQGR